IVKLRSTGSSDSRQLERAIQETRDSLRKKDAALHENEKKSRTDNLKIPKTVTVGETVLVMSVDKPATVVSLPNQKGEFVVQAGIIKMTVKLKDVRVMPKGREEKTKNHEKLSSYADAPKSGRVSFEIDIRGMLVDDACHVLEGYLSDAFMHGLSEVNIIHGKGTGALRNGVWQFLKGHKLVKSFRMGNYGEGDAGVTVVTLKK
ncbi:MAG: Smr/MutS family protein, partial [Clostridia bacterium]|nr:Smr/MutS family protein [Clostridia bacterium]